MKQLDALREAKNKSWYTPKIYLNSWQEFSGTRYAILTPDDVIGWGFSWESALVDADRRQRVSEEAKP